VGEAEVALAVWKAAVIRERRWHNRAAILLVLAGLCGALEVVHLHRQPPVASDAILVIAFLVYAYTLLVLGRRRDLALEAFRESIHVLHYGDDTTVAAARSLLQSAADFDR
jgi:hypothetical protein